MTSLPVTALLVTSLHVTSLLVASGLGTQARTAGRCFSEAVGRAAS